MPLREINLNGFIDTAEWFGDEITPEALHELLYEPGSDMSEDVHIRLNSFGGDCNAATRMHDELAAYPGRIICTVSGTVASAATVMAMAADRLEMTPGSLWMIHNPSMVAVGNEAELMEAIGLLRACKDSIINVYTKRCRLSRAKISEMMDETTWMDARTALKHGFVDGITESATDGPSDCIVDRAEAEKKVRAWRERHTVMPPARDAANDAGEGEDAKTEPVPELQTTTDDTKVDAGEPMERRAHATSLEKRLKNLKHQLIGGEENE